MSFLQLVAIMMFFISMIPDPKSNCLFFNNNPPSQLWLCITGNSKIKIRILFYFTKQLIQSECCKHWEYTLIDFWLMRTGSVIFHRLTYSNLKMKTSTQHSCILHFLHFTLPTFWWQHFDFFIKNILKMFGVNPFALRAFITELKNICFLDSKVKTWNVLFSWRNNYSNNCIKL